MAAECEFSPPPSGVPCSAAMTGLGHASIASITAMAVGWRGGLPNSVMSAPATNVRPAQRSRRRRCRMAGRPRYPVEEPGPDLVFHGINRGLSMVMTGDVAIGTHAHEFRHGRRSPYPVEGAECSGWARKMRIGRFAVPCRLANDSRRTASWPAPPEVTGAAVSNRTLS